MKRFKKILRVTLKTLLILLLVIVVAVAALLAYSTIDDYAPAAKEGLKVEGSSGLKYITNADLSLITWNIGYCSLGKEMDFFYDGGKHMRADEAQYQIYLNGVFNFLAKNDSLDMVLLQEIDVNARRSYYTNQVDAMREALPSHAYVFAKNYDVDFVPMPMTNPMAKVESGLMTFSKYAPATAERYAYPLNYSWPMKLFMLDRGFIMERFKVVNGKELIIVNLHNSAYADADQLRLYELWMLRSFLLSEYEKGNYVIAGGDWNQAPEGYDSLRFYGDYYRYPDCPSMEKGFWPESWHQGFDPHYPTNRNVNEAYRPGLTPTTILDFFITSPNVAITQASVMQTGFAFSDHQPVYMKIRLLEDPLLTCPEPCAELIQMLQDSLQVLTTKASKGEAGQAKPAVKPDRFFQRK